MVDEFEEQSEKDRAIEWYSKESFIYKLINKAFRSEDLSSFFLFRLFIGDLSDSIASERRLILKLTNKTL